MVLRLPERIEAGRVRLILVSPGDAADMLSGRHQDRWHPDYPREDDRDAASLVSPDASPEDASWGPRHIVVGAQAVGSIGCFGPPADGETEVGYGLVEAVRGHGLATEALQALVAEVDRVGVRLRATTAAGNRASLRVLAKTGFTELRGTTPDDEIVLARPLPPGGPDRP